MEKRIRNYQSEVINKKIIEEFSIAKKMYSKRKYNECFFHLERLHVLGQRSVYWHTVAHFYMLRVGFVTFNFSEIVGQLLRLPLGILGSLAGVVPVGNTGGSNVGMFRKMDIPADLALYLED